jgi:hypothetical protein
MVDEELIKYIKKKLNDGGNTSSEDSLKLLKVYKQVSTENEKLRDEFEDMAMLDMSFVGKIIISDENKKFWLEFKGGKVDFGEGDVGNPTLTFTTTMNIFSGILFGQIEISSAHKAGDVSFEGSGEELMDFQAITSVINDFLQYS